LFDYEKWRPRFAEKQVKTIFLEVTPQKRSAKAARQLFGKVWENLGKKFLHPQKFACSCASAAAPKALHSVSGNTLQQVEAFKYLRVVFTSDGCQNKEIDTRIAKANTVLRELYCSVVAKRELSKTAELSIF